MTRALLLTLAFLAACGPAQRLMREGRQAEAARQWGVAYRAYDSALRYKPGHPEALAHRGIARDALLDDLHRRLEQAFADGALDRVKPLLGEARNYDPDPAWVESWQERWRTTWIDRMEAGYSQADREGAAGDRWVYAAMWSLLDDSAARDRAMEDAFTDILASDWPAMGLRADGRLARDLRGDLAVRWRQSDWAEVPLTAGRAPLALDLRVDKLGCETTRTGTRTEIHGYKDGTMVPNPMVPELNRDIRDSLAQLDAARGELDQRQATEDQTWRAAEAARRDLDRAVPELDAMQREVYAAAERRDALHAAVGEAESAADTLHHLRGERDQLQGERDELLTRRDAASAEVARLASRLERVESRLADARAQLQQARRQARTARQDEEAARERLAEVKASRAEIVAKLEALGIDDPQPPEGKIPMPRLLERQEQAHQALGDARSTQDALQRARDRAAEAATTGGEAEQAALVEAEAKLAAHVAVLEDAEDKARRADIAVLEARLFQLDRRVAGATAAVEDAARAEAEARSAADALEPAVRQSEANRDRIAADHEQATRQFKGIDDRISRIEHRLPRLRDRMNALRPVAQDLGNRQEAFRRALGEWRAMEADLGAMGRIVAELTGRRDDTAQSHAIARANRIEAASVVDGWVDRLETLKAELERQPDRVELEKSDPYTVTSFRRTCAAQARWVVRGHQGERSDTIALTQVDEDDTWAPNRRTGLRGDPLAFAIPDDQVMLALRAQLSTDLATVLFDAVRVEGATLREDAPDERDARTRTLLLARFMNPEEDLLAAHLEASYQLPGEDP